MQLTSLQPSKAAATTTQAWTLRFIKHKTTVLLLVQSTDSFSSIKQELLSSITATGVTSINGVDLPSDPSDVILGVPVDKHDLALGWVDLEIDVGDGGGEGNKVTEKKKKEKGGDDDVLNGSPLGAGLKDGSLLAFKFAGEQRDDWDDVVLPSYDDEAVT